LSGRAEGFIPLRTDGAKQRRIDDQLPERADQGHVDRREATDAAHVNAEIEAVPICRFDKGTQRCAVGGTVDQLEELLVFEAVYDTEKSFARARWRKGPGAIGGCQASCEGFPRGCGWLAIPAKPLADEETDVQERVHERRGRAQTRACRPQELIQRDAGACPRQINGPRVMKRHAGKKVVNPQGQPFELLDRDAWHGTFLVVSFLLFFVHSRVTGYPEVDERPPNFQMADHPLRTLAGLARACRGQFSKIL
jgi:hypothetical protein